MSQDSGLMSPQVAVELREAANAILREVEGMGRTMLAGDGRLPPAAETFLWVRCGT